MKSMVDDRQEKLNIYMDSIVDFIDKLNAGTYNTSNLEEVTPKKPDFLSVDDKIDIYNVINECDSFPKTFARYREIFASHPTYENLHFELNNDDNWCD